MDNKRIADKLIIPIYINEKTVLDMLAILEDGFSMISQVNYSEHLNNESEQRLAAKTGTSSTILSKLLKINITGEISHAGNNEKDSSISKEKYHTNASLLSKFRSYLVEEKILKNGIDISKTNIGDYIEIEGELQKNPLINYSNFP